jgi:hypothetical protein
MALLRSAAAAVALALLASAAMAQPGPNSLSAAEKATGWKLLFDGKTTAGWRAFRAGATAETGWTARDGALSPGSKTSKDIITDASFENFELMFEWRIEPKGNTGVMFHVTEDSDETYHSGPEYQIVDNKGRQEPPVEQAAGLYALYAPSRDMTRPIGQFNQSRLVVDHGKVQHWLNGVKVTEYDVGSADFKARVAGSKFKQWPQFAMARSGAIALQNHGDPVAFRNLKIRTLP